MPLRPGRDTHRPVIATPVVRATAAAGTAKIVSRGVDRRQDRREDQRDRRPL